MEFEAEDEAEPVSEAGRRWRGSRREPVAAQRAPLSIRMFSGIRARFCKWTPWEARVLAGLSQALAEPHRPVLQAQLDAVNKIQRIVGWAEIDFFVIKQGRVCWDGVPCFQDTGEFRLARARTVGDGVAVQSELTCINGHLFCIESEVAVKPLAFRSDVEIQIYEMDSRYV